MALPERHTADPSCQRQCTMRFPPVRPRVVSPERRHAWVLRFELERDALCVWQDLVANRLRRGPNWRASSSGVRPLRTSSTIRCRNSGAYGGWLFGSVDLPFRPNDGVSTKPGQRQENLALRQQVAVWKVRQARPQLRATDRLFWVVLLRLWKNWRSALQVVRPETVVRWHRQVSLLKSHPPRSICIRRTDRLFRRSWSDGSESSLGH